MPSYANRFGYANIAGEDIERDPESWEATTELCSMKNATVTKLVQLIMDEASKHLDLRNFTTDETGPFAPILRAQQWCMAFQGRLVSAEPQVETTLDILAKNVPNNLDEIRKQETTMRKLIAMYERGSNLPHGSKEDAWASKLMKNMIHARSQGLYINDATRTNVVAQIGALMKNQS